MKSLYSVICLVAYLLLVWQCTPKKQKSDLSLSADSIYTYKYITHIHITEPQRALALVDEAEKKNLMSDFRADNMRAIIYDGIHMDNLSESYLKKVNESDSMKTVSPEIYLDVKTRIVDRYIASSKFQQALDIAPEILRKARETGNKRAEYNMLLSIAKIYEKRFSYDLSDQYYAQAIQLLENSTDAWELALVSYSYGTLMNNYYNRKELDKAIEAGKKRKLVIDRIEEVGGAPKGYTDEQYGFLYSKMAGLYLQNKQPEKATEAFRQYQQTRFSQTVGKAEAVPYLIMAGKYDEAKNAMRDMASFGNDTISYNFLVNLQNMAEIAIGTGQYQKAVNYKDRFIVIQDSLYARDKQNAALELATIYETSQKNEQIKDQKVRLDRQRIILIAVLGVLLLTGFMLYLIIRNLRSTKRKNRSLASQINSQLAYREELKNANKEIEELKQQLNALVQAEQPESVDEDEDELKSSSPDKKLFDELDRLLDEEKLYLDPDISRDQLIKQMHISKNVFSQLIQTYSGTNFKGYINSKRLDYSITQLKDNHNHTIEAIAIDSGFNNVRSFYRLFRDKYGMTPSEYRDSVGK